MNFIVRGLISNILLFSYEKKNGLVFLFCNRISFEINHAGWMESLRESFWKVHRALLGFIKSWENFSNSLRTPLPGRSLFYFPYRRGGGLGRETRWGILFSASTIFTRVFIGGTMDPRIFLCSSYLPITFSAWKTHCCSLRWSFNRYCCIYMPGFFTKHTRAHIFLISK